MQVDTIPWSADVTMATHSCITSGEAELDPRHPMSRSATIHDIRTLLLSFYPMLVIETVEEDRVQSLLRPIAASFRLPLFAWTITNGLVRLPAGERIVNTKEPLQLLQYLERP